MVKERTKRRKEEINERMVNGGKDRWNQKSLNFYNEIIFFLSDPQHLSTYESGCSLIF